MAEDIYNIGTQERVRRLGINETNLDARKRGVLSPLGDYDKDQIFVPKIRAPLVDFVSGFARTLNMVFPKKAKAVENKKTVSLPKISPTITPSIKPTISPTKAPSVLGKQTVQPRVKPISIKIPGRSGEEMELPEDVAQPIFKAFDPIGEATRAAQVLHHPMQVSGTPDELAYITPKTPKGINWFGNTGENPDFEFKAQNKNENGSLDRGLFQINSDTFNGLMSSPYWKNRLQKVGITSYDDMDDPYKNAEAARLILERGNWDIEKQGVKQGPLNYRQWYAAPKKMRW